MDMFFDMDCSDDFMDGYLSPNSLNRVHKISITFCKSINYISIKWLKMLPKASLNDTWIKRK